jgi:hypothetical protein
VSHTSVKTTSAKPTSTKSKSVKSTNAKSKSPKPASLWRFYDLKGGVNMNLVVAQPLDFSVIRTLHVPTRHSTSRPSATQHPTARQSIVQHPAAQHPTTQHPVTQHPAPRPQSGTHYSSVRRP